MAKGIILCEGLSDMFLLAQILQKRNNWSFIKKHKGINFSDNNIAWYLNSKNEDYAIWPVGGCNFIPALREILRLEQLEHQVESLIIITDHDDDSASDARPREISKEINNSLKVKLELSENLNQWHDISFEDSFSNQRCMHICYLLVPIENQGALETFMLNSLSNQCDAKKEAIKQVKAFLHEFSSNKFLTKRREKIKAELSVSISIFNPDRMFDTLKELIESIDWVKFENTNKQFNALLNSDFFN